MIVFWLWLAGAVLMAALGPSPRWLAAAFQETGGRDLRPSKMWTLWSAQIALWPVALCWFAREAMYGP